MFAKLFPYICERICLWLCPGCLFNREMSLEIDRLIVENEALKDLLHTDQRGG